MMAGNGSAWLWGWIGEKKSNKKIKKIKIVDEFWGWIIHPSHPQTISAV